MGRERRKHFRIEVCLASTVVPRGNEAALVGLTGTCSIRDLSPTGLMLFMPRPVPEGTLLDIEFRLPDDPEPVKATGKVIWTDRVHLHGGVQVVDIQTHDLERIGDWLSHLVQSGEIDRSLQDLKQGLSSM